MGMWRGESRTGTVIAIGSADDIAIRIGIGIGIGIGMIIVIVSVNAMDYGAWAVGRGA
jgi:hypothetical protein